MGDKFVSKARRHFLTRNKMDGWMVWIHAFDLVIELV